MEHLPYLLHTYYIQYCTVLYKRMSPDSCRSLTYLTTVLFCTVISQMILYPSGPSDAQWCHENTRSVTGNIRRYYSGFRKICLQAKRIAVSYSKGYEVRQWYAWVWGLYSRKLMSWTDNGRWPPMQWLHIKVCSHHTGCNSLSVVCVFPQLMNIFHQTAQFSALLVNCNANQGTIYYIITYIFTLRWKVTVWTLALTVQYSNSVQYYENLVNIMQFN